MLLGSEVAVMRPVHLLIAWAITYVLYCIGWYIIRRKERRHARNHAHRRR
jgi:cbb3-type cytochrome oxidase subunit 3